MNPNPGAPIPQAKARSNSSPEPWTPARRWSCRCPWGRRRHRPSVRACTRNTAEPDGIHARRCGWPVAPPPSSQGSCSCWGAPRGPCRRSRRPCRRPSSGSGEGRVVDLKKVTDSVVFRIMQIMFTGFLSLTRYKRKYSVSVTRRNKEKKKVSQKEHFSQMKIELQRMNEPSGRRGTCSSSSYSNPSRSLGPPPSAWRRHSLQQTRRAHHSSSQCLPFSRLPGTQGRTASWLLAVREGVIRCKLGISFKYQRH